jgi:uncharacterized protein YpiB (UPF0302 family)
LVDYLPINPYNKKKVKEVKSVKEKSYSEIMKASVMKRIKAKETFVQDLYVDMLISEIQLKNQKEKLLMKIDKAIDERNRTLFFTLTEELKALDKQFGT